MSKTFINHSQYFNTPKAISIKKQPVTPKTLLIYTGPLEKFPGHNRMISDLFPAEDSENLWKIKCPITVNNKEAVKAITSPVPEFAKEYLRSNPQPKVRPRSCKSPACSQQASKKSMNTGTPHTRGNNSHRMLSAHSRVLNNSFQQEPTLHKILRLFKPQIRIFHDKDKIKRFSTETPAVKKSKAKLISSYKHYRRFNKKDKRKQEESRGNTPEMLALTEQFDRPAATCGEKLWKLKELSILNEVDYKIPN